MSTTFLPIERAFRKAGESRRDFAPGEWLLSSYIATSIENVPIFIEVDNAEKEVEKYLKKVLKKRKCSGLNLQETILRKMF